MSRKQLKIDTILRKYDGMITGLNDLTAGDPPSALFYILADKLSYLLDVDEKIAINPKGVVRRRKINPIIKTLGAHFLSNPQIIENRNFLRDPNCSDPLPDTKIALPDEPVIWASNHGFKDDGVDLPFYKGTTMHISIPPFIIYGLGNSIYSSMVFTMKTGELVPDGEIGELYISSDNLFVEYLNNAEETKRIKDIDEHGKAWVKTGDLCCVDPDGYVIPKGRNRRLIKKEAFKISPDSIEEVIISLPFVKDCVVVGVDDEKSVSVPMAFIELNENIEFSDVYEQIKETCERELPDYEVPSYFEQIGEMPYTPNEKHDFRKLEELGNEIVRKIKR